MKPTIILIAAHTSNYVIGLEGNLPWHIREDMQHFKSLTMGHPILMGRKTFESLNSKPLVGRTNIVVTHDSSSSIFKQEGVIAASSINQALAQCLNHKNIYVIGGASIYQQTIDRASIMEITEIHQEYEGDAWFPKYNTSDWIQVSRNDCDRYSFVTYKRKHLIK